MEKQIVKGTLPSEGERVLLDGTFSGKYRVFAIFLICCALLLAAFAVSSVWLDHGGSTWLWGLGGIFDGEETVKNNDPSDTVAPPDTAAPDDGDGTVKDGETDEIPNDAVPILSRDLAYLSLGRDYIHNETPYHPSVDALLAREILFEATNAGEPLVLILHTHTSEAFLPSGTRYIEGRLGDATYSRDESRNILSVGAVLCETLKQKGITAIHCTVMHDDPTLGGAYARADATIEEYLERYPSISLVIDLHRDAITNADGAFVRSVAEMGGEETTAQVMAVVGTNGNGTSFDHWEENLALALQLRELLNADGASVCRPVSLRNSSYNQEMAPHALLLEIGTAANSVDEAQRAAVLVGETLARLLQER